MSRCPRDTPLKANKREQRVGAEARKREAAEKEAFEAKVKARRASIQT